jgi:hypothetical protein
VLTTVTKSLNTNQMLPKTIILKVEKKKLQESPNRMCSSITLNGVWLEKAGFLPDDSASVSIYNNTLIIRPVKKDTNE